LLHHGYISGGICEEVEVEVGSTEEYIAGSTRRGKPADEDVEVDEYGPDLIAFVDK
jgi:hypothetical protein